VFRIGGGSLAHRADADADRGLKSGYLRLHEPMASREVLFDRLFDGLKTSCMCLARLSFRQEGGAYRRNGTRCEHVIDGTCTAHDMASVAASGSNFFLISRLLRMSGSVV
jgi:hypothetical protein